MTAEQTLIDSIACGVILTDGRRLSAVNAAAAAMLGSPVWELAGREIDTLFYAIHHALLDAHLTGAILHQKNSEPLHVPLKQTQNQNLTCKACFAPWLREGKVLGAVLTLEDITQSSLTQDIINRKQKNLEAIFDAAPVGMLLINNQLQVCRVNESVRQLIGREFVQIINRPVQEALNLKPCHCPPEGSPCATAMINQSIQKVFETHAAIRNLELQPELVIHGQTLHPWFSFNLIPANIDGDSFLVLAYEDISSRKQAEAKLKETMELKYQFISTVSHELRTPLACIKEGVDIVLDGLAGKINAKQRNFLDIAHRNIDRLATLVNDVLDFQKLGSGKMSFDMRENNINQIITEVQTTLLPLARKNSIDLRLDLAGNLPLLLCDNHKIIQVITNLVSNAIKFTPAGGSVTVTTRPSHETILIKVIDTGLGIPQKDLGRIFEQFFRVNRPGLHIQGTGLGLTIVQKIVEYHQGEIAVQSEVNQGTTFTISLPVTPSAKSGELSEKDDLALEEALQP